MKLNQVFESIELFSSDLVQPQVHAFCKGFDRNSAGAKDWVDELLAESPINNSTLNKWVLKDLSYINRSLWSSIEKFWRETIEAFKFRLANRECHKETEPQESNPFSHLVHENWRELKDADRNQSVPFGAEPAGADAAVDPLVNVATASEFVRAKKQRSDPFGGAKPVDTRRRDEEVARRLEDRQPTSYTSQSDPVDNSGWRFKKFQK